LDFTCGSASTLIACQNTNRKGIGIELDDKYFDVGVDRVEKAYDSLKDKQVDNDLLEAEEIASIGYSKAQQLGKLKKRDKRRLDEM